MRTLPNPHNCSLQELETAIRRATARRSHWNKAKRLRWGRFEPVYLPPYSPDLNPIERLWLLIKAEWFTDFVAKSRASLIDRLDKALLWALHGRDQNTKTCSIKTQL